MKTKNREIKWIFGALLLLFAFFLTFPVLRLLAKSFQGEALTLSDRVLIINEGTISQFDTPSGIVHQPENGFVRRFILNQLEIKRNNIFSLFEDAGAGSPAAM